MILRQRAFATPGGVYNATPARIVFGAGALGSIASEVERLGAQRALVLCTPGRAELAKRVATLLGARYAAVYAEAVSQVPIELARVACVRAKELEADCLIAVGGGAATGLAKAIGLETALPIIDVPTTYSGSEMTGFCGITIDGVKRMHESLNMLARTVIYDPELTLDLPPAVSAASAMNGLAHCIEALYAPTVSPIHAFAAAEGIRALGGSLPRVIRDPHDSSARSDALYGAYLAGAALAGGFGLQHGVAHVLGATFGIRHADAHSIALPYVTAYNAPAAPEAMRTIAAALGSHEAAGGIHDFATLIGAPVCLAEYGMTESDLDRCAAIVVETDNGLNPRAVDRIGVRSILELALRGERP